MNVAAPRRGHVIFRGPTMAHSSYVTVIVAFIVGWMAQW
jgi:hypothetical protein